MIPVPSKTSARQHQAIEVLLGYLEAASWWPGADGLTLDDALLGYPKVMAAGWVPDRNVLIRKHPELRDVLLELLAAAELANRNGQQPPP